MERTCPSCGQNPGDGAFCQHCGTRLAAEDQTSTPEPVNPPPAAPTPPPAASTPPQMPAKRSGCLGGCLPVGVIAIVLVAIGGFFAWRYISNEILPEIEETAEVFTALSETPAGPCYDLEVEDGFLTGWTEVSCSGSRQIEVSFAAQFEEGPFPGDSFLTDRAADTCREAFETYVGISPEDSVYGVEWLLPTEETWSTGDRQGVCLVVADDGSDLTGTVKESNR